jgi:hypothetical protein
MKKDKLIGTLLILGAIGVLVPYSILTFTFNYPGILRMDPGEILRQFHSGGSLLILTWLAFALLGIPLLIAYSMIGQRLENQIPFARWATTFGMVSGFLQIIGLLRWVFVIPVLAAGYVNSTEQATQESIKITFKVVHQFAGVLIGEHLGQLFTVLWTIFISAALLISKIIPKWLGWWGFLCSFIYLLAQSELLATVIPGFPVFQTAGFLGSTLWLVWLVLTGIYFINTRPLKAGGLL